MEQVSGVWVGSYEAARQELRTRGYVMLVPQNLAERGGQSAIYWQPNTDNRASLRPSGERDWELFFYRL